MKLLYKRRKENANVQREITLKIFGKLDLKRCLRTKESQLFFVKVSFF